MSFFGFLDVVPLGPKGYCCRFRRLLRRPPHAVRHTPPNLATIHQHGPTDWIHNSSKHSTPFLTKVKVIGRAKVDDSIFYMKLPMSMEMTQFDFQLSTDNKNASLLALSVYIWDRKQGYGGHLDFINFNKSLLCSVECLETWKI